MLQLAFRVNYGQTAWVTFTATANFSIRAIEIGLVTKRVW
jgi:hypothetical protein